MNNVERPEIQVGDKKISFEVGGVARQAAGAALVRMGDTVVIVAAANGTKPREDRDFFPLTVDYRERTYAAGRIPGGFFKREGKARDNEILTSPPAAGGQASVPGSTLAPQTMRHTRSSARGA